jgi:hypothetical protein
MHVARMQMPERLLHGRLMLDSPQAPSAWWIIGAAALGYAGALVLVYHFVPPSPQGSWDDTVKAAAVAVSLVTALVAPISTIFMALYQARITSDLERLKTDYTREVENLKAALSARLEMKKALIAGKVRAFDQTLSAAHFFYYVIRRHVYATDDEKDAELIKEADKRAAEASALVWNLPKEDRARWFLVYQHSMFLLDQTIGKPRDERIRLLDAKSPELGEAIEALETAGREAFEEAERHQLRATPEDMRLFGRAPPV